MSALQVVTWNVARAGGFTAYGLLVLSIVVGLLLTLRVQSPQWPRIINSELHNFLTLLAAIFTGLHVLTIWIDPFTHFNWQEVFVPLLSHYRNVWMALGIVGLYLGLAIGLSTWLRPYIGYNWWRRLHGLTLVIFALVSVHGLAMGSDSRTWWSIAIYAISIVGVGGLLCQRLLTPIGNNKQTHPVLAGLTAIGIAIITAWSLIGPLSAGWGAQ